MKMKELYAGQKVRISGAIKYGNVTVRCDSNAVVINVGKRSSLVAVDYIDGDFNVSIMVQNKLLLRL